MNPIDEVEKIIRACLADKTRPVKPYVVPSELGRLRGAAPAIVVDEESYVFDDELHVEKAIIVHWDGWYMLAVDRNTGKVYKRDPDETSQDAWSYPPELLFERFPEAEEVEDFVSLVHYGITTYVLRRLTSPGVTI